MNLRLQRVANRRTTSCAIVVTLGLWLWLFWPLITGQTTVGFRDSAYLFYPYFQWIDQTWAAGEIPLWNPNCDLGYPVVGDATSGVFYPGKLVFFCRFLSFPARYGLFIAGHVLLAGVGACWVTRHMGGNPAAASLTGFSYALCGNVLFQSTNVIYLVSASLLPFAVGCSWIMFRHRKVRYSVAGGCLLALFILGGDPQMAYVVALIMIVRALSRGVAIGRSAALSDRRCLSRYLVVRFLLGQFGIAVFLAAALSAVQMLPSMAWARQSERVEPPFPTISACWAPIRQGSRVDEIYQFSQPPWTLMELFWPNVSGRPYPVDRHWSSRLPGADRIWTPSLYLGLPAMLLGLSAMRLKGNCRRQIWLTKLALFFSAASFGWYGVVWLINEMASGLGLQTLSQMAEPVGGLYWLMLIVLPKFFVFRYPAKLFVVASLAICVLAGLQLSRPRNDRLVPLWLPVMTMLGLGVFQLTFSVFGLEHAVTQTPDPMFGPFDAKALQVQWRITWWQTVFVSSLVLLTTLICRRWATQSAQRRGATVFLVVVSVVDLWMANHWLVPQVDSRVLQSSTRIGQKVQRLATHGDTYNFRYRYAAALPRSWQRIGSSNRLNEIIQWQRERLHPKHHLAIGVNLVGSFTSIAHPANNDFAGAILGALEREGTSSNPDDLFQLSRLRTMAADEFSAIAERSIDDRVLLDAFLKKAHDRGLNQIQWSNNRVGCQISCERPMVLLFNALPLEGWRLCVRNCRTNRVVDGSRVPAGRFFLAARVPAGQHYVEFRYSPREFWAGAIVSAVAWCGVFIYSWQCLRGRRRFRIGPTPNQFF